MGSGSSQIGMTFPVRQRNGYMVCTGGNTIYFLWCNKLWSSCCNSWHLFGKWDGKHLLWKQTIRCLGWLSRDTDLNPLREMMVFKPTSCFFPNAPPWKGNITQHTLTIQQGEASLTTLCLVKALLSHFEKGLVLLTCVRLARFNCNWLGQWGN